jgi:alpha-beta hydrolase superfamily lysophospholipase
MTLPFCEIGDWLDANIFMFDLRGHGNSGGRTISLGNLETTDALAAIEYVREHRREESQQVVGMGLSLGAAVMAEAAGRVEPPLAGVILDSGFASTREMTQNLPCPPFLHDWMLTVGLPLANWHAGTPIMTFCPEASIGNLRAPVVVAHARLDPITPSDHSRRFFERAAEPKQLLLFEINGHCDGFFAEKDRYQTAIRRLGEQMQVGFQGR